jgi:hypothetical protein
MRLALLAAILLFGAAWASYLIFEGPGSGPGVRKTAIVAASLCGVAALGHFFYAASLSAKHLWPAFGNVAVATLLGVLIRRR